MHAHTFTHTYTQKYLQTWRVCVCTAVLSVSLQAHFPHLIPGQELAIRNVHTLLCTQHLIWAEEIGKKRRKEESAERWEGQQMRGKRTGRRRGGQRRRMNVCQSRDKPGPPRAKVWVWDWGMSGGRRHEERCSWGERERERGRADGVVDRGKRTCWGMQKSRRSNFPLLPFDNSQQQEEKYGIRRTKRRKLWWRRQSCRGKRETEETWIERDDTNKQQNYLGKQKQEAMRHTERQKCTWCSLLRTTGQQRSHFGLYWGSQENTGEGGDNITHNTQPNDSGLHQGTWVTPKASQEQSDVCVKRSRK